MGTDGDHTHEPGQGSDTFELFDLLVTVDEIRGRCTCRHRVGESFTIEGGKISLPPGQSFCIYALQAALPLLPAKQRPLQAADWMTTDDRVICPDPSCGLVMRIERAARRTVRHADVSAVQLTEAGHPPSDAEPTERSA